MSKDLCDRPLARSEGLVQLFLVETFKCSRQLFGGGLLDLHGILVPDNAQHARNVLLWRFLHIHLANSVATELHDHTDKILNLISGIRINPQPIVPKRCNGIYAECKKIKTDY